MFRLTVLWFLVYSVHNWTNSQVVSWIVEFVHLPQYKDVFSKSTIDGSMLPRFVTSLLFFMVYRSCVRSAMLYGSETWCLMENEIAILRRAERAMVRAMCGAKLMEKKRTEDLMEMLGSDGSDGKGKWSEMVRACVEER